ncbi:WD40 repeat-like protein [Gigaspora margarita]|uniref:WD40 repeat-like protein n=1 Tax=Gigaspora margarita TaxID=4874 RepID=A0A8H4ABE6_GIGMA|nr:WD40 repeat-like protein [Gigaspora margarita]
MDLCFTSSSVATNLFDEILNSNGQLQTDESNSLTNSENESDLTDSEEGLYPLAKGQSFSDWNDVEKYVKWRVFFLYVYSIACHSDNKYIWTATSDSSLKRWLDVPPRHIRKAISQTSSPSMSMPPLTIPLSLMINFTSTGKLESLDIENPIPLRDSPDFAIKVYSIGKRDFNEVVQEVNTIEYIPTWYEVDTRIGALTVHLDERTWFDAEAYADELNLQESADIREDQRINLGEWVLRNLFANFTRTLIEIYEELQAQNLLMPQRLSNDYNENYKTIVHFRYNIFHSISYCSGRIFEPQNVNPPLPTTSTLPQSPTTPLAAFTTGPLTAPAATGSQQPDYFLAHIINRPLVLLAPLPPPPALINQTSSSSGSSSSIFGRFKLTSVRSKISKTPNTKTKPESSGTSVSTENNADTKTDSKPSASTRSQDESSAQVRKDEESKVNSSTRSKVQAQHTGDSNRHHPIHHGPHPYNM